MNKELAEAVKLFISQPLNFPLSRGQIMEVARIALPILEQQERGEDEWIEWGGGERPTLSPFQQVEYLTRIGNTHKLASGELRWKHLGRGGDIIAYRIIPERDTNQNGEQ